MLKIKEGGNSILFVYLDNIGITTFIIISYKRVLTSLLHDVLKDDINHNATIYLLY